VTSCVPRGGLVLRVSTPVSVRITGHVTLSVAVAAVCLGSMDKTVNSVRFTRLFMALNNLILEGGGDHIFYFCFTSINIKFKLF
jgi:hypothetical protein